MLTIVRSRWKATCIVGLGALLLLYAASAYVIGGQVREAVSDAQALGPGKPVAALIEVVESPGLELAERNRAVWALGQLGDRTALPTLEARYTGDACDHSVHLCQRELGKAIDLCRGETNIGAFVWRRAHLASH